MSQQELKRVEVVALRRSGQIDQAEAARRVGLTVRQVRRLEALPSAPALRGHRVRVPRCNPCLPQAICMALYRIELQCNLMDDSRR